MHKVITNAAVYQLVYNLKLLASTHRVLNVQALIRNENFFPSLYGFVPS